MSCSFQISEVLIMLTLQGLEPSIVAKRLPRHIVLGRSRVRLTWGVGFFRGFPTSSHCDKNTGLISQMRQMRLG
jgi:hypothetical protein